MFEPTIFRRSTRGAYDASNPHISASGVPRYPKSQEDRWRQLEEAHALDARAAYEATCLGVYQICGSNYSVLGFASPGEMSWFASQSETNQLEIFVRFIEKRGLLPLLKQKDWAGFVRKYVGPGQPAYVPRLEQGYSDGMRSLGFFAQR